MKNFHENEPFLRGLIKWIGFRQVSIEYYPNQRTQGESKYHFKRMISFALQGVTSFSVRPLYVAIILVFRSQCCQSCIYHMFACIPYRKRSFRLGIHYHDYCIFWRLKLMILGIIGIYVGKMFMQVKERPNYIIRSTNLNTQTN
jgi:hypothetical protein